LFSREICELPRSPLGHDFREPGSDQDQNPPGLDQISAAINVLKRYGGFVTADLHTYATIARQWGRPDVVDEFMRDPKVRYLAPSWRVVWPQEAYQRRKGSLNARLEFLGRFTKAMADAGVPLVTVTGMQLQI
jgi:hypothetical protein